MTLWERYEAEIRNAGLTKKRRDKLKLMFDTCQRAINLDKATRQDIEKFVNELHSGKFCKLDGSEYSGSTKSDLKKFLKAFYKWLKGENTYYPKEVAWIKTRISKDEKPKEKDVISVQEVRQLANSFSKIDLKVLTLMLFDSGFRIAEMLSAKKQDLSWENYQDGDSCFWIKCNSSKTEQRKVPIPIFTEDLQAFFNSSQMKAKKDSELLFDVSYEYYLQTLKAKGKELLKKKITPHALRHSSASLYAKELNGNAMSIAQRYGWSFSSKELATYIRRSGAYHKDTPKLVFHNENVKLREEMEQLRAKYDRLFKAVESFKSIQSLAKSR